MFRTPALAALLAASAMALGLPATTAVAAQGPADLIDRVWVGAENPDLPGIMWIFLSDGTLVMDSCWETHRFSAWKQESYAVVSWIEDGMDIRAEILALDTTQLVLRLDLGSESVEQRFTPAEVPYVCPDMPR